MASCGLPKEKVWDYPRPAIAEPFTGSIKVAHDGKVVAESTRAWRVLETSHPPTYYIPPEDINFDLLVEDTDKRTMCEWKGVAGYYDIIKPDGKVVKSAAWTYKRPTENFVPIKNYLSFYATKFDECFVNGERIVPQKGDFYGGWITSNLEGPFKGAPGTLGCALQVIIES